MKKIFCVLLLLFIGQICFADWNTLETKQDAYDRKSYENYNTYKNTNYQAPLGGYNRPINDNGGRQYGMNYNNSFSSNYSDNYSRTHYNARNGF